MKKITSLLLAILMVFSVVAVGAVSVSAADEDIAFKAGSFIYFDNTNTQWDEVYFYAWNYGYFGDMIPMDKVDGENNLYKVVVPVDVPEYTNNAPTEYFLFTSSATWSGKQTNNMPVEAGMNTYTPAVDEKGNVTSVKLSYTDLPLTVAVAATPASKSFTGSIDVTIYAFNLAEGEKSTYSLNGATPVEFTDKETFKFTSTTKITVTAGSVSKTYDYTSIADANISVTAEYESGDKYTGDIYAYTFGGDRVAPGFELMKNLGDGEYAYTINGSGHVIFTTTNDWATAVKFTILDENYVPLPDQEPLVSSGESVKYVLTIPDPEV